MSIRQIPKGPALVLGNLLYSNSLLGVAGVTYETNQFRGLDDNAANGGNGNDGFSVSADHLTFNINMWTTTNVVDEVRIILGPAASSVPDSGSTLSLCAVAVIGLLCFERRCRMLGRA